MIREITYLRGFIIFFIVLAHSQALISFTVPEKWMSTHWANIYKFFDMIIYDDSAVFVFISGFLFYKVFYQKGFSYRNFIINKVKNVLIPYIFLVSILMCLRIVYQHQSLNILTIWDKGMFYWVFWYIPMAMLLFLFSPLYISYIESSNRVKTVLFILSFIASLYLGRRNLNPILSVAFWNTFYLLGISCAQRLQELYDMRRNLKYSLVILYIVISTVLIASGNWLFINNVTWQVKCTVLCYSIISKSLFCVSLLFFFEWFDKNGHMSAKKVLAILADYSFAIYFLHNFLIYYYEMNQEQIRSILLGLSAHKLHFVAFIATIGVIIVCVLVSKLVRMIFGKYSRLLIGA